MRDTGGRKARDVLADGRRLLGAARSLLADHESATAAVRTALAPIVDELAAHELESIPAARLKDVTQGRLRLAAIEAAGFSSVARVLDAGRYGLRQIAGVGPQTADQAYAAARQIAEAVAETVAVRIDVDRREPRTTALVIALHRLVAAGPEATIAVEAARQVEAGLGPPLARAAEAGGALRQLFAGAERRAGTRAAVDAVAGLHAQAAKRGTPLLLGQASVDLLRAPASEVEAWVDFETRPADYYSLLAELSGGGPDVAAAEGFLPADVVERVRAQPLDGTHRRVSLRGYQAFGARFALAQRRVLLGDEMGLGKTIQALAALAHLAAQGRTHFLVVCPAGVLVNWTRETRARSALRAVPLHGPGRHEAFAEWRAGGGVGVTTYDALRGFPAPGADGGCRVAMLVVDEAHYVKNPEARRTRAVAEWAADCERVLFMTGTPMENRVAEFRSLVRHLQPGLLDRPGAAEGAGAAGSQAFRRAVAPAYLRRNQVDVLAELPALLHTDEWAEFSAADQDAYRTAVLAGNFMAMRRAAYADPEKSAKLGRLRELVAEAADNGLKVVVFSYFRDVLGTVADALGPAVFGPLTGSVAPVRRQQLVDAFSAVEGHAVLLAQIEAGGVGLNLQAASVVILCEPQVKPTIEHQAVARAHRMGQLRPVRVHRLLGTTGVDERLLAILRDKARLFDAYARRSDVAEAAPDAVDVSDVSLARQIVEEEQNRLAGRTG